MKALFFSVVEFLRLGFLVNFVAVVLIVVVLARFVWAIVATVWGWFLKKEEEPWQR